MEIYISMIMIKRQTDRQTDRQIDIQTGSQTARETEGRRRRKKDVINDEALLHAFPE